jgi:ribosomal protein L15
MAKILKKRVSKRVKGTKKRVSKKQRKSMKMRAGNGNSGVNATLEKISNNFYTSPAPLKGQDGNNHLDTSPAPHKRQDGNNHLDTSPDNHPALQRYIARKDL